MSRPKLTPRSSKGRMHVRQTPASGDQVMRLALDLSQAVSAELEIGALCALIVNRLSELTNPNISALLFVNESRGELEVREALGMTPQAISSFRGSTDRGLFGQVIASRKPLLTVRSSERVREEAALHVEGGPLGMDPGPVLIAPLVADRRVQGVLVLVRSRGRPAFTGAHLLIDLLCAQIAQAIDNAWLYGQLRSLNRDLERKVSERTAELDAKAHALERALRELKDMQCQYVRQEKMASLGLLTAGIAHEINNPLAYATSNVAVAKERLNLGLLRLEVERVRASLRVMTDPTAAWQLACPLLGRLRGVSALSEDVGDFMAETGSMSETDRARLLEGFLEFVAERHLPTGELSDWVARLSESLARAIEGLGRVKEIILDLRAFARLDEAEVEQADLDQGIVTTLAMIRHLAKASQVSLVFEPGMRAPYPCRPSALNQVVMNLVVNAVQASRPGQLVSIRTRDAAEGVTIEVEDCGIGIAGQNLEKIFDPFFTTKPVGEGMGLGLSLCYRIVSEHGGQIVARSEEGKGALFSVMLPPRPSGTTPSPSDERTTKSSSISGEGRGANPADSAR